MDTIKLQIKNYFDALKFEQKQHRYSVNGKFLPSVSGLIKNFVIPFNAEEVSIGTAKKRGISQKEVLAEWDATRIEACDRGHRVHDFGEHYVWNRNLKPSCNQEKAIVKFWNDLPLFIVPVIMELQMYHKDFMYAGTADILLYNTITQKFIIADYKTNKDLFKNYKEKKMLFPFGNLLDCPFNKYQLQFSFYQLLFEQTGFEVSSRKLIWLLKDGTYRIFDTQDYRKELTTYLAERN
jgi:hypothetical protein